MSLTARVCSGLRRLRLAVAPAQSSPSPIALLDEQIAALEELAWWEWPDERLLPAVPGLCGPDIEAFLNEWAPTGVRAHPRALTPVPLLAAPAHPHHKGP